MDPRFTRSPVPGSHYVRIRDRWHWLYKTSRDANRHYTVMYACIITVRYCVVHVVLNYLFRYYFIDCDNLYQRYKTEYYRFNQHRPYWLSIGFKIVRRDRVVLKKKKKLDFCRATTRYIDIIITVFKRFQFWKIFPFHTYLHIIVIIQSVTNSVTFLLLFNIINLFPLSLQQFGG